MDSPPNMRRSSWQSARTHQHSSSSNTLPVTRADEAVPIVSRSTLSPTNETSETAVPRLQNELSSSSDTETNDEWSRKTVLTLDGGGIKGVSSLLILRQLMFRISEIERAQEPHAPSSVFPLDYRPPIRHAHVQAVRHTTTFSRVEPGHERVIGPLAPTSEYLPCHYFDYIAGSSTGGLIAIMLGRLGMTVDECLDKYENLAHRVFKHPRTFHIRRLLWPRSKYDATLLEGIIKGIVSEYEPSGLTESNYPQKYAHMCRTIVIAYLERTIGTTRKPYLFRSYRQPASTEHTFRRQMFDQDNIPIWKVARATSAAPTYFRSVKVLENDDKYKFIDGGWGCNNPTEEVYRSIRQLKNNDRKATSIIVSIGTGKPAEASDDQKAFNPYSYAYYLRYALSGAKQATDSERIHENFIDTAHDYFPYYRLNVERNLGDLTLDAFEGKNGKDTLMEIADATTVWLATEQAQSLIDVSARTLVEIRRKRAHHFAPAQAVPTLTASQPQPLPPAPTANGNVHDGSSSSSSGQVAPPATVVGENWQDRLYRWERFVHGVEYQCRDRKVCKCAGDEFLDRRGLRQHLVDRHGQEPGREELEAALDEAKIFPLFEERVAG